METSVITAMISSVVAMAALMIISGVGELMAQRTGVINIGIDGIMSIGALTGIIVVNGWVPNSWLGLLSALIVGLLIGIIFGFLVVTLKTNQFLTGLAITFIGNGISKQIGNSIPNIPAIDRVAKVSIPGLRDIPVIGHALFEQNVLVYLALFLLPFISYLILHYTRHGMIIRAVGQNPTAADSSGISIAKYRYLYVCIGCALSSLAGAYLTLSLSPSWSDNVVAGKGWIVILLVIFSRWNPLVLLLGALIFGAATSLGYVVQVQGWGIDPILLSMLPYIITIILVALPVLFRKQETLLRLGFGPASLGQPFHRE
jgi:simple sugar transport system permease protein